MNPRRSLHAYAEAFVSLVSDLPAARVPALRAAFIRLLVHDRVLHRTEQILDEIDRLLLEREGTLRADVQVATGEDEERQAVIERLLTLILGQPVRARMSVDDRLIAGFRARVEDVAVDASLRGHLTRLKSRLRHSPLS